MLLRESIEKTKNFLQKSLLNLKLVVFGRYQKLPKPPLLNLFSCSICRAENEQKDENFTDFYTEWESDPDEAKKRNNNSVIESEEAANEEDECSARFMSFAKQNALKNKQEVDRKEEKKKGSFHKDKREDQCCHHMNADSYALAQKMKQLDMMDAGDVEHELDIEEALHYYSRLRSPAYLDIVDRFFTDMYSEFSVPQASSRTNSSKRRLGSIRL
ncbi:uncharacterized protein LOC123211260 [Mangifera indica]|uniref:uncharacterized protein LOC123211260 n=1 Tax=Mangifera indica TaxID=29780 RepID=UPI001CF972F2|nr:uncharacterized protein LOC123211260 [Mangifera indica]